MTQILRTGDHSAARYSPWCSPDTLLFSALNLISQPLHQLPVSSERSIKPQNHLRWCNGEHQVELPGDTLNIYFCHSVISQSGESAMMKSRNMLGPSVVFEDVSVLSTSCITPGSSVSVWPPLKLQSHFQTKPPNGDQVAIGFGTGDMASRIDSVSANLTLAILLSVTFVRSSSISDVKLV